MLAQHAAAHGWPAAIARAKLHKGHALACNAVFGLLMSLFGDTTEQRFGLRTCVFGLLKTWVATLQAQASFVRINCTCVCQNYSLVPAGGWGRNTPLSSVIPETSKLVRKFRGKHTSSCWRTSQNRHIRPTLTEWTPTFVGSTPLLIMRTDKDAVARGSFLRAAVRGCIFCARACILAMSCRRIWEETVPSRA